LLSREDFIGISIEVNLFFQRIMKEHLFFIEVNLQPVAKSYIDEADRLKRSFEQLLSETLHYANGIISKEAMESNAVVTPYTLKAEEVTSKLTGASINMGITRSEYNLAENSKAPFEELDRSLTDLNRRSLNLLKEVIAFKQRLLDMALDCKIFISLYPELLEHLVHEAKYYSQMLESLQKRRFPDKGLCDELNFWNHIMEDHAQFIDGMLDPTERPLKETAKSFAKRFENLVEECIKTSERLIIQRSSEATSEIRDFKKTATKGLLECKIKSIIPPLLADHVLREANFYLRMLKK
jgi:hypothetical protein